MWGLLEGEEAEREEKEAEREGEEAPGQSQSSEKSGCSLTLPTTGTGLRRGLARGSRALTKKKGMWEILPEDQHCRREGRAGVSVQTAQKWEKSFGIESPRPCHQVPPHPGSALMPPAMGTPLPAHCNVQSPFLGRNSS